jgi:hypothetical protein
MLLVARMYVHQNATLRAMLVGPRRCGVPIMFGSVGTDSAGDDIFALAFEWTTDYARLPGTNDEQRVRNEQRQLDRFRADFRADGKPDPFASAVRATTDPPDFLCERATDHAKVGVELTQFTFEERIGEQALFDQIKRDVLTRGRGQLAHLRGLAIVVTFFGSDQQPALPGASAAALLLAALRDFKPPPQTPISKAPEKLTPEMMPVPFEGGELTAVQLTGDPGNQFYRLMRWELLLSSSGWIASSDAWEQLVKIIKKKDVPGNDELIVVCGSPTTPSNWARPADTLLARAALARAASCAVPATKHLDRIWLHSWPERSVYELVPGCIGASPICGEPFAERPL